MVGLICGQAATTSRGVGWRNVFFCQGTIQWQAGAQGNGPFGTESAHRK